MSPRILLVDCETAPAKAHVWGLFNQNIGLSQVLEDPRMMGFGAKWLGDKRVQWFSEYHHSREQMLTKAHDLLDEADVVVHYNGNTFDTPWFQGELAREDMPVPSPFKQIDLYRVIKKNMRFLSHKLAYVSPALIHDTKVSHAGHRMWVDCLEGEGEVQRRAWASMRKYCRQDVALLEPLFHKVRPYFPASVNMALYTASGDDPACTKCGSTNLQKRGFAATAQRAYQQFRCNDCGGWSRDNKTVWSINTVGVTR